MYPGQWRTLLNSIPKPTYLWKRTLDGWREVWVLGAFVSLKQCVIFKKSSHVSSLGPHDSCTILIVSWWHRGAVGCHETGLIPSRKGLNKFCSHLHNVFYLTFTNDQWMIGGGLKSFLLQKVLLNGSHFRTLWCGQLWLQIIAFNDVSQSNCPATYLSL